MLPHSALDILKLFAKEELSHAGSETHSRCSFDLGPGTAKLSERLHRGDSLQYYQLAVEGLRQHANLESVNVIYAHYFFYFCEFTGS